MASTSSLLTQSSRRGLKRAHSGSQSESPATRPRLDVSEPESVVGLPEPTTEYAATQTAETDDAFNKAVLSSMAMMGQEPETSGPLNLATATILLMCIDQLDPRFKKVEEAAKFLRDHNEVFEQLNAAWKNKSFAELQQHG